MGLFSSGSSTSRSGSAQKWAKKIAKPAAGDVMSVYHANEGNLSNLSGQVSGLVPGLVNQFNQGDAGVDAAGSYISDVLGGKYLNGNPHLQAMMDRNAADVTSRVGAAYGSRGSFGGTAWESALGKAISDSNIGLMYGNYSDEMNRMGGAAGMAPGIAQAQYTGLPEILNTAGMGAELPYTGINAMTGALGNLFSGGQSKQTGPGIGGAIIGGGLSALGSYLGRPGQ